MWLPPARSTLTHGLSALPLPVEASLFSAQNVFHSWANECHLCPRILHLVWESPPRCTQRACTNLTSSPSTSHRKRNIPAEALWFRLSNLQDWMKPWLRGHRALTVWRHQQTRTVLLLGSDWDWSCLPIVTTVTCWSVNSNKHGLLSRLD